MTSKEQMTEWLSRHKACREGRAWAGKKCASLDEVWGKAKPEWLIWVAVRAMDKRNRVAFGAACAERVLHLMPDERSRNAVAVAKRYGQGFATDDDLSCAYAAAYAAASADAFSAAAAAYAAYAAAAYSAAANANAAANATERAWQAAYLRANFKPDWTL